MRPSRLPSASSPTWSISAAWPGPGSPPPTSTCMSPATRAGRSACWRLPRRWRSTDPAPPPATYLSRSQEAVHVVRKQWGVDGMSVLVIGKFQGDTATFRQAVAERAGEFAKYADMARAAGGIPPRFRTGAGLVLVADAGESPGPFQKFLPNPELPAFIGS